MSDVPRRERRSPMVMLLDAAMRLAVAAQSTPQPRVHAARVHAAQGGRRAGIRWLAVGVLLAVAGIAVVVGALLAGPDDLASLPPRTPARTPAAAEPVPSAAWSTTEAPTAATTTRTPDPASASATASTAPGTATTEPPATVLLTARYATVGGTTGLLGYVSEVTIANPGVTSHDGWQLTVTLPRETLEVARVSGAVARQDGATWTFEPDETTRSVRAGSSVLISFEVRGATLLGAAPLDCRIDNRPCSGINASPS